MNSRKLIISEEPLETLNKLAMWHNQTPKLWIDDYELSDYDIAETLKKIKKTKEEDIYISVVEDDYNLIGFLWATRESDYTSFMIMSLYIEPLYRNKRLASMLKVEFEAWCKNNDIKKIKTTVNVKNKKMIDLNIKLGYKSHMVSMSKTL